ncbi:DUF2513 domain-containing protein [Comamonas aquatica]|uniref:DUF2513 domain-containing protein n=1 Tax=Comamonas aquatica TaxID=225991 RepID=UPI00244CB1F3|nr:DUF2513 domain-containing protein [Comamonas aquatica]MDH0494120.1 DUF2513 domain-containing protein [Comamonas aquatica]
MKRDMEVVRKILLACEALPFGKSLGSLEGVDKDTYITHVVWMQQAGLVDANAQAGTGSFAKFAIVFGLTWEGCELADAMRDETLWEKAKAKFMRPGISFTLDIVKDWLKTEITQGLPTLRS